MLNQLLTDPLSFIIWLVALVVAITIHEFAHAWMAERLGDPTARLNNRLTLNPLAHLDPLGTLMLFLTRFGWGKPVPVDYFNLANPRRDSALISLAGPMSNFILASLLALILRLVFSPLILTLALPMIIMNVSLGVFNLLPIPPLDGSKIILGVLPAKQATEWQELLDRYGSILLILLLLPLNGLSMANRIISPIIETLIKWLVFPGF